MKSIFKVILIVGISTHLISCDKHEKRETKYDNGQLKEQFSVLETEEGSFIKDGDYKTWFDGGQSQSEGQYENGKMVGNWKTWFSNGQMESDLNYVRDTLDGKFLRWYENGQKMSEGMKKMGIEVGPWTFWYENGQMSEKRNFDEVGKNEGLQTKWHSNGQKSSEENYLKGVYDGELKYWDNGGKLYVIRTFKNGNDLNLPSVYKNKTGEKLELNADGKYKLTYQESYFFSTTWKSKTGEFRVTPTSLDLDGFRNFTLKKFNADTIVVDGYRSDIVFIKQAEKK